MLPRVKRIESGLVPDHITKKCDALNQTNKGALQLSTSVTYECFGNMHEIFTILSKCFVINYHYSLERNSIAMLISGTIVKLHYLFYCLCTSNLDTKEVTGSLNNGRSRVYYTWKSQLTTKVITL